MKRYITPTTKSIIIATETQLMAGSLNEKDGVLGGTIDTSNTTDEGGLTRQQSSLWDTWSN